MKSQDFVKPPKLVNLSGTLQLHIAKEGNDPNVTEAFLKPRMAGILWTSTAKLNPNGSYSSEWSNWCKENMEEWFSSSGHLFKVEAGARVLQMNNDNDAIAIGKYFNYAEPKNRWWQNLDVQYHLRRQTRLDLDVSWR